MDNINPNHYKQGKVEYIVYLREELFTHTNWHVALCKTGE